MLKIDMEVGGSPGAWGRTYIYATYHKLGVFADDTDDSSVYAGVAHLLDQIEARTGEQCVLGILTRNDRQLSQQEIDHQTQVLEHRGKPRPRPKNWWKREEEFPW